MDFSPQLSFDFGTDQTAANDPIYGSPLLLKAALKRADFDRLSSRRQWKLVMERACWQCEACHRPWHGQHRRLEIDHRVPLAMGGDGSLANLWALCPDCHRMKTAMDALRYQWKFCPGSGFDAA